MSLTIDQILAEARGDNDSSPQVYSIEKKASEGASGSSGEFSDGEIEKMASLLRSVEVPTEEFFPEVSFQEKVAEALILSQTIQGLTQNEEETKLASFTEKAVAAGYSPEEIETFLYKNASKAGIAKKVLVGTGIAGAAGFGGYELGEHRTKKKARKAIKQVGTQAYMQGRSQGRRKGFVQGASASNAYWRRKLHEMRTPKAKEAK